MVKTISNLTGIRFYLAAWVILFHTDRFDIPFLQKGYLAVDCFFILSGFILTHVYKDRFFDQKITRSGFIGYLRKRFLRLYPVHIATLLSAALIIHVLHFTISRGFYKLDYHTLWSHLLMVHAWNIADYESWNEFSWSISAEWFAYIFLLPTMAVSVFYLGWKRLVPVIVALYIVFLFFINQNGRLDFQNIYRIVPEFLAGSCFYLVYFSNINRWEKITPYLLILFAVLVLSSIALPLDYTIIPIFILLIGVLLSDTQWTTFLFSNKWIVLGGEISYSMYMVQVVPLLISRVVIQMLNKKFGIAMNTLHVIFPIETLTVSILLGYLSYKYVERPFVGGQNVRN